MIEINTNKATIMKALSVMKSLKLRKNYWQSINIESMGMRCLN